MSLGGIVAGLVGSGQGEKTIDLSALLDTIKNAGQYQQTIINALPPEIQQNLAQYAAQMQGAGTTYQGNVTNQGADYLQQIQGLYGPNSPAATAQKTANTTSAYANVPGTQMAIRNAMAATGGLGRGQAGVALAQPYVQAAQTSGQANMNVNAQQTMAGQQATQQALTTINSMDANMFQQLFGMTQAQATQILQTGNGALQQQLSALINQSNNQTTQMLDIEGTQAQNAYQNALQQAGNQNAIWTGLANGGVNALQGLLLPTSAATMSQGLGQYGVANNFIPDVTSAGYDANNKAMAAELGY